MGRWLIVRVRFACQLQQSAIGWCPTGFPCAVGIPEATCHSLSLSLFPFDLLSELPFMRGGGSLRKAAGFLSLPSFADWQRCSKVLEVVRG
mmetsp:Transcript_65610/g.188793  ORF Transcript_65610/g.188793 Transcript_65610/m.188793 type:complete len:91 (+) Transcript_65610:64-336(+)